MNAECTELRRERGELFVVFRAGWPHCVL